MGLLNLSISFPFKGGDNFVDVLLQNFIDQVGAFLYLCGVVD
jgi:hypothetical protein